MTTLFNRLKTSSGWQACSADHSGNGIGGVACRQFEPTGHIGLALVARPNARARLAQRRPDRVLKRAARRDRFQQQFIPEQELVGGYGLPTAAPMPRD